MPTSIPRAEEQDKLIKQLNDIDSLERQGIFPERNNVNLFLLGVNWVIGILWSITNIINGDKQFVYQIFGFCILLSLALTAAFYNKKWGMVLVCLLILFIDGYETYLVPGHYSQLIIFLDSIAVFTFTNQFRRSGFIFGITLVLGKIIGIQYFFGDLKDLENILASTLNVATLGLIPLLIASISRVGRRAKKGEIRAEILARQNEELMKVWEQYYSGVSSKSSGTQPNLQNSQQTSDISQSASATVNPPPTTNQPQPSPSSPTPQAATPTTDSIYSSPYVETQSQS
jgi:hypothetical protein